MITTQSDYGCISEKIKNDLFQVISQLTLIENKGRDICFFPVNNRDTNSNMDTTNLMGEVETCVSNSQEAQREIPLQWLRVLDRLQKTGHSYLSYREVCSISVDCGVDSVVVPHMLLFWRNLGMLLWIDEPGLHDVVILDAIHYLVEPASRVICQLLPEIGNPSETVTHNAHLLTECGKRYPVDWIILRDQGILTEKILDVIWRSCIEKKKTLLTLMTKFGLLLPVIENRLEYKDDADCSQPPPLYLIPALLPKHTAQSLWPDPPAQFESCFFLFIPKAHDGLVNIQGYVSLEEIQKYCFLPVGLFERIAVKVISWCQIQLGSGFSLNDMNLDRSCVVLPFGQHMLRLMSCPSIKCIKLDVQGNNPLGIYNRISKHINTVIGECFPCLRFAGMRLHSSAPNSTAKPDNYDIFMNHPDNESQLILISKLQSTAVSSSGRFCHRSGNVTRDEILSRHAKWIPSEVSMDSHDIFISYRWNDWDKVAVSGLYDALSYFALGVYIIYVVRITT